MSRTDLDFSKHEMIVTKTDNLLIHHLKVPGTYSNSIVFINDYQTYKFTRKKVNFAILIIQIQKKNRLIIKNQ